MGNPRGVQIDHEGREERRLRAASMFGEGMSQAEVARQLSVSRQTAYRWAQDFSDGGAEAMKWNGHVGRPARLTPEMKARLTKVLEKGAQASGYLSGLWTARRVTEVIWREFHIRYHKDHVWKILRSLGWSCQRPTKRAIERDEEKIRQWKNERWPALKKTPQSTAKR
jgi:transposase